MQRQLISTNVYIFVVVLIVAIILGIIYQVLAVDRPTDLQTFNKLNPFPAIKMKHVPPPEFAYKNPNIKDCSVQILPCTDDNDCKNCGLDYTCTPVDESENLVVNGNKIGAGSWCLPKNKLSGCGKYTGQVVWSGNELGQGEWACICKYPSLFTGETCLENKACKDTSIIAGGINQDNNNLVNSQGQIYNPNLTNFYPPNSEANPYARENVYDKDGNLRTDVLGKPIYTCSCGTNSGKVFVSLPNDPQGCNLDPCTASHSSPLWNTQNQTCICGLNDALKTEAGTCVPDQCAYGHFNPVSGSCECMGRLGPVRCHTDQIDWGVPTPTCEDPENPSGIQCIDRCIYKYCQSDNPDDCGGPDNKGYRPSHFDDGNAVVCIGGSCIFDDENNVSCNCPGDTSYDDSPGSPQYGVCLRAGGVVGDRCYMKRDRGDIPYMWLQKVKKDDAHPKGFEPVIIDYKSKYKYYGKSDRDSADGKCRIRCAGSQEFPWGDVDKIREIVNSDDFDADISCTPIQTSCEGPLNYLYIVGKDSGSQYFYPNQLAQRSCTYIGVDVPALTHHCGVLCGLPKNP